MDQKRVNIFPRGPVTTVVPPIRVPMHKVTKKISDIRLALLAGAKVEEILPDGSAVLLNINNYDKDNTVPHKSRVIEKIVVEAKSAEPSNETVSENKESPSRNENAVLIQPEPVELQQQTLISPLPSETEVETVVVQPIKQNNSGHTEILTRKQRRAYEAEQRRKEQEAAAAREEIVEVKNPEDGNV